MLLNCIILRGVSIALYTLIDLIGQTKYQKLSIKYKAIQFNSTTNYNFENDHKGVPNKLVPECYFTTWTVS